MTDLSLTRQMTFKPDARYKPIACGRFRDQTSLQAESCRSDWTRLPGLSCLTGRRFNHVNYAPIEQCSCAHGAMCTKTHGKGTARVLGLSPRGRLAATLCFRRSSPKGRSRLALRTLE